MTATKPVSQVTHVMGGQYLAAGNLPRYDGPHAPLMGFPIDRTIFPTRWAEFSFILESLSVLPSDINILDTGTGFNPEIHALSCLLGALEYRVVASDLNPLTLDLPSDDITVIRKVDDLTALSEEDESFDVYTNVSVLEHLTPANTMKAFAEAYRVLKHGGILMVTADYGDGRYLPELAAMAGFVDVPILQIAGAPTHPPTSWIRTMKP